MKYSVDTKALKKAMIDEGISTQIELSQKANISVKTVNGILNGKITPSTSIMYNIASCLNLPSKKAGEIFFAVSLRNT